MILPAAGGECLEYRADREEVEDLHGVEGEGLQAGRLEPREYEDQYVHPNRRNNPVIPLE